MLTDAKRVEGQRRAAAKRKRIGSDIDERVSKAIAGGVAADAHALSGALVGVSYFAARRSLQRLGLWRSRAHKS